MQVTTVAGAPVEIHIDELKRAARAAGIMQVVHNQMSSAEDPTVDKLHKFAKSYMEKALDCIEHMSGHRPTTEKDMKCFMFDHLPLGTKEETDLHYECIEAIIGWFACRLLMHVQE